MYETYHKDVEFLVIYIREAHALDGVSPMGGRGMPLVEEPTTKEERKAIARTCSAKLDMSPMTVLIDDMKDTTNASYSGHPDRLYLVGKDGKIAYAGDRGPWGFKPDELDKAIQAELKKLAKEKDGPKKN